MNDDTLYNKYEKYCCDIAHHPSGADARLCTKIVEYEESGLFDDMMFYIDSIVSKFVTFQYQNTDGTLSSPTCDDKHMTLDENCFRFYVRKLKGGVAGQVNKKQRTLIIDPKYAEVESTILHEMIHAYESIINERMLFYHDILTLCLYKDLITRIPDLDGRILAHTHVVSGDRISREGGSHDILFFLKSLDLDLRCNLKLGTVCSYGRDQYSETRTACD